MDHFSAGSDPSAEADAHGRAALLLVESLIHGLIARSALSAREAVEIIEIALDAQIAIIEDAASPPVSMQKAAVLLSSLMQSLSVDVQHDISGPPDRDAI